MKTATRTDRPTADFLVVGGGVAGCVIASRLSEDPHNRIVLVEAGQVFTPEREPEPVRDIQTRAFYNPAFQWTGLQSITFPDATHRGGGVGRPYTHGRILGGGSSINGVNVHRGLPEDYDEWAQFGLTGWSWDEVLPFFRKLETDADFGGRLHGTDGPLHIQRTPMQHWTAFERLIHDDWRDRGLPDMPDLSSEQTTGRSAIPIATRDGERMSLARAYLTSAVQARPNLEILGHTEVTRLLIENRRAIGLEALRSGESITLHARHIVLTAGSIFSPMLLQRAGIGEVSALKDAGIEPVVERRGVGSNLQNHPVILLAGYLRRHARVRGRRPMTVAGSRFSSGMAGCGAGDMGGLTFGMVPDATRANPLGRRFGACAIVVHKVFSRGYIEPTAQGLPRVIGNSLADERDMTRLLSGLRIVREQMLRARTAGLVEQVFAPLSTGRTGDNAATRIINLAAAMAMDSNRFVRDRIFRRFAFCIEDIPTETSALRDWIAEFHGLAYHIAGTCRMGRVDDPDAVVDERGRVIGIDGLTVADPSVFPTLIRGGTMVPAAMVAEKIAASLGKEG